MSAVGVEGPRIPSGGLCAKERRGVRVVEEK